MDEKPATCGQPLKPADGENSNEPEHNGGMDGAEITREDFRISGVQQSGRDERNERHPYDQAQLKSTFRRLRSNAGHRVESDSI